MNAIDALPHGPDWKVYKIGIGKEAANQSYVFTRNIMEVVKDVMANPAFKECMHYAPERHYTGADRSNRVYGNPHTADWWWRTQIMITDKFGTVIPLIIASDRTRLSVLSGGQQTYPVYVTLANIDKRVRRQTSSQATVLLAYLPVDDFAHAKDAKEKAKLKNQMTHLAMELVMRPLHQACTEGVEMACADGRIRRGYPIVAGIVGDWPEHCMMACVEENRCPRCMQSANNQGSYPMRVLPRSCPETLETLNKYFEHEDLGELKELGLQPWWPWWANLPYVDFHAAIMPDVLHQLHQGMIKYHLVNWVRRLVGKRRVDQCYMVMPSAEGMRHFKSGISKLKGQWTGRESREVAKQLLPITAGQRTKKLDPDLTGLTRSILEFTYQSHASRMTNKYVNRIERTLGELHHFKDVLIREKVFADNSRFDGISKLHMLLHYAESIREMGTPDNYSTKAPKHLHIECAKKPWWASNKVRPTPQMITFMQRYEALRIAWSCMDNWLGVVRTRQRKSRVVYGEEVESPGCWGQISNAGVVAENSGLEDIVEDKEWSKEDEEEERREQQEEEAEGPKVYLENETGSTSGEREHVAYPNPRVAIPERPTAGLVKGLDIVRRYGAEDFILALHAYINKHKPRDHLPVFFLPTLHHHFPVWHRLYLHHQVLPFDPEYARRDVVRARPQMTFLEAAFDVALLMHSPGKFGLHRYRAGRVQAIFSLPKGLAWLCPHPLVYVEWFNPFSKLITPFHRLNTTSHSLDSAGRRRVAVVPIHDVVAACHLAPQMRLLNPDVTLLVHSDLLSVSRHFYHNHYYNHFIFGLVEHWRAAQESPVPESESEPEFEPEP